MRFNDLLKTSTESLRRNTTRSLLTVLGIVIGVGAVIVMLSVGQGAQNYILGQVADLGSDQIFVESGSGAQEGGPPSPFIEQNLTLDDAEALRDSTSYSVVATSLLTFTTAASEQTTLFADVAGVDEFDHDVFGGEIAIGRTIDRDDVEGAARVVVLGKDMASEFFGEDDPIGQWVRIKDQRYRVIGVMAEQGSMFFSNLDRRLYIPVTTMQQNVLGVNYVNYIALRAVGDVEEVKDEARLILRETHAIDNPEGDLAKDDFLVSSQADAIAIIEGVGMALSAFLASIAAISLLVGGIGIMNIMLVSVTERTREIGLRKAIGATYKEILQQFLLESIFLTLTGGVMGIVGGIAVTLLQGLIVSQFIDGWSPTVPVQAVVLAVVVSTAVGLIFGIYPARRAARLNPIESLRYE